MPENMREQQPREKRKYKLTREKPNKREQILTAAIKVMGHYGYDGTTIDKIALEAGVSSSLVKKHFVNKEKIAGICIQRICETLIHKMQRASSTSASYRDQTDRIFSLVQTSRNEMRLLIALMATPALEHIVRDMLPEIARNTQEIVGNHNEDVEDVPALSYTMTALYFNYLLTGRKDLYVRAKERVLKQYLGEK